MQDRVFKVISQVMNIPADKIDEHSSPDNIGPWDSLKHMTLILALEEEFGIRFSNEQIVNITNAGLIADTVKELMRANK